MKKEIEWVDTVKGNGYGQILPSELLKLVHNVREEALDAFELAVRKQGTFAEGSDAAAAQKHLLGSISIWRRI